ncbi:MAG: hypothetical protein ACN6PL_01690, partial [Pseudomonas putida]
MSRTRNRRVNPLKHTLGLSLLALGVIQASSALAAAPTTGNEVEARVSSILDNMNMAEKINFTRVNDGH